MTTTEQRPTESVEARADALRAVIAEVDAEASQDTADRALDDLAAWQGREHDRTRRRFEAADQLQRLVAYGALVDDQASMDAVTIYNTASREPRTKLAFAIEHGAFRDSLMTGEATKGTLDAHKHVAAWWDALEGLVAGLSPEVSDARRIVRTELMAWVWARSRVWEAILHADNRLDLARPENAAGEFAVAPGWRLTVVPADGADDDQH